MSSMKRIWHGGTRLDNATRPRSTSRSVVPYTTIWGKSLRFMLCDVVRSVRSLWVSSELDLAGCDEFLCVPLYCPVFSRRSRVPASRCPVWGRDDTEGQRLVTRRDYDKRRGQQDLTRRYGGSLCDSCCMISWEQWGSCQSREVCIWDKSWRVPFRLESLCVALPLWKLDGETNWRVSLRRNPVSLDSDELHTLNVICSHLLQFLVGPVSLFSCDPDVQEKCPVWDRETGSKPFFSRASRAGYFTVVDAWIKVHTLSICIVDISLRMSLIRIWNHVKY